MHEALFYSGNSVLVSRLDTPSLDDEHITAITSAGDSSSTNKDGETMGAPYLRASLGGGRRAPLNSLDIFSVLNAADPGKATMHAPIPYTDIDAIPRQLMPAKRLIG